MNMPNENINPLTGLYTAGILKIMLSHELALVRRHPVPMALLRVSVKPAREADLDVTADDRVAVARIFHTCLRAADVPMHYEDDYLVALPMTPEAGARRAAQRLTTVLAGPHVRHGGGTLEFTTYTGLTSIQSGNQISLEDFVAQANAAHAEACRRGPGSVVTFGELT